MIRRTARSGITNRSIFSAVASVVDLADGQAVRARTERFVTRYDEHATVENQGFNF